MVTIFSGKVEYGQGVWTALAQVAAEELDVDLGRVRVAPVSTATSPDEGITSGSRSIEESGSSLRQACAQARHVFLAAAADRLGVEASALGVADGEITADAGGTGLTYWRLAGRPGPAGPGLLDREAGDPQPAKAPARWSVAGRSAARLDIPDKVAGRPRFLHDLVLPGMLYGRVIRPPAPAASLAGLGDPAAAQRRGDRARRLLPGGGGTAGPHRGGVGAGGGGRGAVGRDRVPARRA